MEIIDIMIYLFISTERFEMIGECFQSVFIGFLDLIVKTIFVCEPEHEKMKKLKQKSLSSWRTFMQS